MKLYIIFLIPIFLTIVMSVVTYKIDKGKIEIIYDNLIDKLNEMLQDFEETQDEKKNSN